MSGQGLLPRAGMRRIGLASALVLASGAAFATASCAESGPDAFAPILDAGSDRSEGDDDDGDGADAGSVADAGCEADNPRCMPTEVSCDETEFCPLKGAVDPRVALTSVWGSGKDDVWAAGSLGTVVRWDGASWAAHSIPTTYTLFGLWGSGHSNLWAVSSVTTTFHGTRASDGSVTWSSLPGVPVPVSSDLYPALASVWGLSSADIWIAGGDKVGAPRAWRMKPMDDGGVAYTNLAPCASPSDCPGIRAIWGSASDGVWLVGDLGRTYHAAIAADNTIKFTATESQTSSSLRAVWGVAGGPVWAVGDDGTVRTISRSCESMDGPAIADDVRASRHLGLECHRRVGGRRVRRHPAFRRSELDGVDRSLRRRSQADALRRLGHGRWRRLDRGGRHHLAPLRDGRNEAVKLHAPMTISATALIAALVACSSNDEDPEPATPSVDAQDAGGGPDDGSDAAASNPLDAAADAAVDAPVTKKTCSDDGFCHTELPPGQILRDVWADGHGVAWAVTDQGNILRHDGTSWTIAHTRVGDDVRLFSVWGSGPNDVWVGGYRMILHGTGSSSAALTWTEQSLDELAPDASEVSVYGTAPDDVFAATGTSVLRYPGEASGWSVDPVTQSIAGKPTAVWGRAGASDVWISTVNAASKKSVLFHRAGAGAAPFVPVEGVSEVVAGIPASPACKTPGEPRRGSMVDDNTLWVVGTRINFNSTCHYLFHGGNDSGAYAFDGNVRYDVNLRQNDVWGSSPSDVWAAGDFGVLSHWDGKKWQLAGIAVEGAPVKANLNAVFGTGLTDLWVVGDGIALHKGAK